MTRAKLRELVQAGLGDLDGHPEQVGALGLDVDNLGRPCTPGKKYRGRSRATVLATSSTGTGATVNCEGDAVGARVGTIANVSRRPRERTVGMHVGVNGLPARRLAASIREAVGIVSRMPKSNIERRGGKPYVGSQLPTQHVNHIARLRRGMGDKNTADQLELIAQLMRDDDQVAARRMLDDLEAQLDAIGDESGAMDARVFRSTVGGRVRMKDVT